MEEDLKKKIKMLIDSTNSKEALRFFYEVVVETLRKISA